MLIVYYILNNLTLIFYLIQVMNIFFTSGSHKLLNVSLYLIACYTPQRKLNFLNDFNEFAYKHLDKIFDIRGNVIKDINEHFMNPEDRRYGKELSLAAAYDTNDKMRDEIHKALRELLYTLDLKNFYEPEVFMLNDNFEMVEYGCHLFQPPPPFEYVSIASTYVTLERYLNKHYQTNEDYLTIDKLRDIAHEIYNGGFGFDKSPKQITDLRNDIEFKKTEIEKVNLKIIKFNNIRI